MNNEDHKRIIDEVITETFKTIRKVYETQQEKNNGPLSSSPRLSRIIFPKPCKKENKNDKDQKARVSEQELRFIFIEQLNKRIKEEDGKWDVYYSVETPTIRKDYGKGDSANFDMAIHDYQFKRIALIEFKANNRGDHAKDITKLNRDVETKDITNEKEETIKEKPLRYFIEVVRSANDGTIRSLHDKMQGDGIEFRCCSLTPISSEGKYGDISELITNYKKDKKQTTR